MSEHQNTEHVLTLKDIEFERDVAMKASLTGSIEYVRMARQIEAAVVAKFKEADVPPDTLIRVIESIVRKMPTVEWKRVGLVGEADTIDREHAAFTAGAEWTHTLSHPPSMIQIETCAARRYAKRLFEIVATIPTVTLSTGKWRKTPTGWQRLMPFTGVKPNEPQWQFSMSQPECRNAEDYNAIAEYLAEFGQ